MADKTHTVGTISSSYVGPRAKKGGKEVKYLDYSSVSGSIGNGPTNWSNWYVPRITRGTESYSRIGNQILCKSMELRLLLSRNSAGTAIQRMHVLVLRTKEPVNTAASATEIYSAPSSYSSPRNLDYSEDYVVLYEHDVVMDSTGPLAVSINKVIPLGFTTKFSANSGTVADCSANNIELILWSDQSSNQPTVTVGSFRIYWTDE